MLRVSGRHISLKDHDSAIRRAGAFRDLRKRKNPTERFNMFAMALINQRASDAWYALTGAKRVFKNDCGSFYEAIRRSDARGNDDIVAISIKWESVNCVWLLYATHAVQLSKRYVEILDARTVLSDMIAIYRAVCAKSKNANVIAPRIMRRVNRLFGLKLKSVQPKHVDRLRKMIESYEICVAFQMLHETKLYRDTLLTAMLASIAE